MDLIDLTDQCSSVLAHLQVTILIRATVRNAKPVAIGSR
jgi:hypothetical protein